MQSRRIEIAKLSLALFAKCETLAKFLIISLLIGTVQKIYATAKCGLSLKGYFLVSGFAIMYSKRVEGKKFMRVFPQGLIFSNWLLINFEFIAKWYGNAFLTSDGMVLWWQLFFSNAETFVDDLWRWKPAVAAQISTRTSATNYHCYWSRRRPGTCFENSTYSPHFLFDYHTRHQGKKKLQFNIFDEFIRTWVLLY